MDRIKEEMARLSDLGAAVRSAVNTTGIAVGFTASTLILGVITWVFVSDLRFQADSALLLSVMLILNALAAVFLVPACITLFKPRFIVAANGRRADMKAFNTNSNNENRISTDAA